ncbi:MAG: hypothetical protein WKF73_07470 [Nocardioidaceae bacterium]
MTRPYAVCTVTVPKTARVAEYGRRLDAAVRRAGFAPLRLDLAQDVAFAASTDPPRHQPDPHEHNDTWMRREGPSRIPWPATWWPSCCPTSDTNCPPCRRHRLGAQGAAPVPLRHRGGGNRQSGRGWAPAKAPVSTWRMTK